MKGDKGDMGLAWKEVSLLPNERLTLTSISKGEAGKKGKRGRKGERS